MTTTVRKRPRIGDVIEIDTPSGFAYAQYTHEHRPPPRFGSLLWVAVGTYAQRPDDLHALLLGEPAFVSFFPLAAACNRAIVRIIANLTVPVAARPFPTFRNCAWYRKPDGTLHVGPHRLWDGESEWPVEVLTSQQLHQYPPLAVINDTLLVERITQGWRHEHHPPVA